MSDQFIDEAGNIWRYDQQGNPVLVRQASDGPVDPTVSYNVIEAGNRAAASSLAAAEVAARINQANSGAAASAASAGVSRANQDRIIKETEREANRPSLTDAQKAVDAEFAKFYSDMQLGGGIADRRKQLGQLRDALDVLNTSKTITGPMIGRLPEPIRQAINPDAINVREQIEEVVQRNLRVILGAQFTKEEGDRLIARAFNPRLQEGTNAERLQSLIDQMGNALDNAESSIAYYEENGTIAGWQPPEIDPNDSAMNRVRMQGGQTDVEATPFGSNQASIPVPPGKNEEHKALVDSLMAANDGRLPPFEYAQARRALDEKYLPWYQENYGDVGLDFAASGLGEGVDYAVELNEALDGGAKTIPTDLPTIPYELNAVGTMRNSAVNNPLGAAALGAGEGLSMGALGQVAPNYAQLAEQYPLQTLGGEMVGAGLTTAGIGGLGRAGIAAAAPRIAPRVFGGGGFSAAGRTAGADAAYGVGQGLATGVDPLTSAAISAAGSFAGSGVGAGLGKAARGLETNPNAQAIMDQGVPLTFARRADGGQGIASSLEDAATSMPVIGDMIKARNLESVEGFNRAAFDEAGRSIGFSTPNIGREGVTELLGDSAEGIGDGAVSRAYSDALDGQAFPLDNQFTSDIDAMRAVASNLPGDYSGYANKAIENRIDPLLTVSTSQLQSGATPNVTGDQFQQALRGLRSYQNVNTPMKGFEDDYKDVLEMGVDALDSLANRQGGAEVVQGLADANRAYRLSNIVRDASNKAKAGGTGEVRVFSPYNLQAANEAAQRKFPGVNPLVTLADTAQRVLPSKLPDSGTAKRALGTAAVLGAAGLGESAYNEDNSFGMTQGGLAAAGLLTLLGTRRGQQLMQKAAFDRPDTAQRVGNAITGRFGNALFGRTGAGLARDIENQRINELFR